MDSLSFWNRTLMEPMIIDIILVQESPNPSSELTSPAASGTEASTETVIERWMVQYEGQRLMAPQIGEATYKKMYRKSIILLRSVHAMLRLLPAYKAFRKLCSLKQNCDFVINYKVCSFSSPFSRAEEESMKKYSFVPIDIQPGRLSVSVIYREDLSDFNLDVLVSCPPQIITDYVERGNQILPPHFSDLTAGQVVCIRMFLHHRANPLGSPPLHRSPYEYSPSPTETYIHRNQNQRFPTHQKTTSDDLLSPPFSSSPSPSPPTYLSGGNTVQSRLRSETAPVSIPHPMMGRSPRFLSPNLSDPSRHSLPPLSPRNTRYDPSSHESSSGIRSMRRLDSLRAGESSSGPINVSPKVARDAKEDSGRFSSLLSSGSSPRVGFSRSSSRLSFQDDFGDCDFSCPFIVDDVDPPDSQASLNPDGTKSSEVSSQASSTAKKSQDAAVGILVHMLKTAPPLRQDSGYYTSQSSKIEFEGEVGAASEFFKPRKTSDALEELKVYKEMKDLLLSKSAARLVGKEKRWT
ncbi:UNVERIFIED_CONTAM: Autophagy-related protein 13a [Sesamum calycinum]|uniref:Autophagy-related protein 13a n=1 Tax=Sesamum calycinum TaxID=2727403 RepID=A0AAW2LTU2_9LAMI